jgi:hypothetical protein
LRGEAVSEQSKANPPLAAAANLFAVYLTIKMAFAKFVIFLFVYTVIS